MREILFKAKRVKNGEWIEWSLIDLDIDSGYCYIVPPYKGASTLPIGFLITDGMELVDRRVPNNDVIPVWCPLDPLPEKDMESYFPDEFGDGYATGWNACIDEITGEVK